mmetsp:Transcript_54074/g.89754  ORF Transcript_54074/g.89754 Transcript_54074/m.89754 type:complete len:123 (-) Transcript_54074:24-392(-)
MDTEEATAAAWVAVLAREGMLVAREDSADMTEDDSEETAVQAGAAGGLEEEIVSMARLFGQPVNSLRKMHTPPSPFLSWILDPSFSGRLVCELQKLRRQVVHLRPTRALQICDRVASRRRAQ